MIERQAVRHPRAAVVADHREALEAERAHHLDLVGRHRALGVRRVIRRARGLVAVAVAAQVGRDDGELARQHRRHAVPHRVGLRR